MKKQILSSAEAARYIGCPPQKVRERMKRKIWDLGEVIPKKKLGNKYKNEYNILRPKLETLLGNTLEEIDAQQRRKRNAGRDKKRV